MTKKEKRKENMKYKLYTILKCDKKGVNWGRREA